MIEGFDSSSLIIINLVNPKEKFFGVLTALSAHGEERNLDLITMFVPLFRVERIFLDEPSGEIKSYAQRFEEVVGATIEKHLGLSGA